MKISTIIRDTYICKIYFVAFCFLIPMLFVLAGDYEGSSIEKAVFIAINLYIPGLMLRWSTRHVFMDYLKKWDNGKEINFTLKKLITRYAVIILNIVIYFIFIANNVKLSLWVIFLVVYKISTDMCMRAFVISDNYILYKKKTMIINNIKDYDIVNGNRLILIYLDQCKQEFKVGKQEMKEIKSKLRFAACRI